MSEVTWVCPHCKAAEPKIVSKTRPVTINSSAKYVHLILCGACGSILGCLPKG